jgi:hypothetical protein
MLFNPFDDPSHRNHFPALDPVFGLHDDEGNLESAGFWAHDIEMLSVQHGQTDFGAPMTPVQSPGKRAFLEKQHEEKIEEFFRQKKQHTPVKDPRFAKVQLYDPVGDRIVMIAPPVEEFHGISDDEDFDNDNDNFSDISDGYTSFHAECHLQREISFGEEFVIQQSPQKRLHNLSLSPIAGETRCPPPPLYPRQTKGGSTEQSAAPPLGTSPRRSPQSIRPPLSPATPVLPPSAPENDHNHDLFGLSGLSAMDHSPLHHGHPAAVTSFEGEIELEGAFAFGEGFPLDCSPIMGEKQPPCHAQWHAQSHPSELRGKEDTDEDAAKIVMQSWTVHAERPSLGDTVPEKRTKIEDKEEDKEEDQHEVAVATGVVCESPLAPPPLQMRVVSVLGWGDQEGERVGEYSHWDSAPLRVFPHLHPSPQGRSQSLAPTPAWLPDEVILERAPDSQSGLSATFSISSLNSSQGSIGCVERGSGETVVPGSSASSSASSSFIGQRGNRGDRGDRGDRNTDILSDSTLRVSVDDTLHGDCTLIQSERNKENDNDNVCNGRGKCHDHGMTRSGKLGKEEEEEVEEESWLTMPSASSLHEMSPLPVLTPNPSHRLPLTRIWQGASNNSNSNSSSLYSPKLLNPILTPPLPVTSSRRRGQLAAQGGVSGSIASTPPLHHGTHTLTPSPTSHFNHAPPASVTSVSPYAASVTRCGGGHSAQTSASLYPPSLRQHQHHHHHQLQQRSISLSPVYSEPLTLGGRTVSPRFSKYLEGKGLMTRFEVATGKRVASDCARMVTSRSQMHSMRIYASPPGGEPQSLFRLHAI